MIVPTENVSSESHTIAVKLVVCTLLFSLGTVFVFLFEWYKRLRAPCDLPVLNLEGWQFGKAKQAYITNLRYYLKIGREQMRNTCFQLYGPEGYVVMIPKEFVEELKNCSDSLLDNRPIKSVSMNN